MDKNKRRIGCTLGTVAASDTEQHEISFFVMFFSIAWINNFSFIKIVLLSHKNYLF